MALKKRGNIWHVRKMVGSILIAKSTKTSNKRLAEQLEAKWVAEAHAEVVVAGRTPMTVKKAIELFMESRAGTPGYRTMTYRMKIFKPLHSKSLHEVEGREITALVKKAVADKKSKINTVNLSVAYWNAMQNYCVKNDITAGPKVQKLKGGAGRIRFLNPEEIAVLLKQLDPSNKCYVKKKAAQDNYDFVMMLLHTGARDRECATIKMEHIDLTNNTLTIIRSKGGTNTTLRLTAPMLEIIARRTEAAKIPQPNAKVQGCIGNGFLFPVRAMNPTFNNSFINRAAKKAGLADVTVHTMRHTFATGMLKAGLSLPEVKELLGHRNIESTMVYAHVIPNLTANRAMEVLNASTVYNRLTSNLEVEVLEAA